MKILYDARHWRKGGIGEVIKVQLAAIARSEVAQMSAVWVHAEDVSDIQRRWPSLDVVSAPRMFSLREQIYYGFALDDFDLVVCPYLTFPLAAPNKVVLGVMDLIWLQRPHYAPSRAAWMYFLIMQTAAHLTVERKIYISHFTRRVAQSMFGVASGVVQYIPVRVPEISQRSASRERIGLLYAGTWKKWKRVPLLVDAFRALRRSGWSTLQLTLIGGIRTNNDDDVATLIADEVRDGAIRNLGYVAEDVWARELGGCDIVIMPSEIEGFGLPVMEGLAAGKRVVARKGSVAEELAGNRAIYFESMDADSVAKAIATAAGLGPPTAEEQRALQDHVREFLVDRYSERFLNFIRHQVQRHGMVM